MKAISALLAMKNFVVRVPACLLIIALLAPVTVPLSAKDRAGILRSPATITGNLAAPEPMMFSGISENAGSGGLSFFAEQWQRLEAVHLSISRSILPAFSLAFFSGASVKETSATSESSSTSKSSSPVIAAGAGSSTAKSVPAASSALLPPARTAFDFDADGKADVAVWKPADNTWRVVQSSNGQSIVQPWGAAGDRIVPADYDGDGKTDYGVYTPSNGMWRIRQSSNGQLYERKFGGSGDVPVPGDFTGDGRADIVVWRPSDGVWYVVNIADGGFYSVQFGGEEFGDVPVAGDYNGDGKIDIAVWRATTGQWFVRQGSTGTFDTIQLGVPGDIPVPADYDGDGKTDYAVWRPSTGEWSVLKSAGGTSSAYFGSSAQQDVLVPADYDADGKADFAVWRPALGIWYVWRSSDGGYWYPQLGDAGDVPVPAAFIKQAGAMPTPTPTSTPPIATSSTYDAVTDFSTTSNPSGAWSYGYKATASSAFTRYTGNGQPWAGIYTWSPYAGGACCLMVTKNTTGATTTYGGSITQPADLLNLHPGPGGEQSTVRWTAPAAGTYQIRGRFQGIDTGGPTTNVRILHKDVQVQSGSVNGYGSQTSFDLPVTVAAGDTIDFAVNYGSNTTYNSDSTGLAAIITLTSGSATPTPTPTPTVSPTPIPTGGSTYDAVNEFSTTSNPSGAWSYGYKATAISAFTRYIGNGQPWAGIYTWSAQDGGACCLMVAKNTTGATTTYGGSITQPADLLNLHPGPSGEQSTVRWTAPAAGTYRLQGRFEGIDTTGATTDVRILHNNTQIADGIINGYGTQTSFDLPVTVAAGDTIDFVVGYGSNNTYNSDSTGLAAIITSTSGTATPTPTVSPTPAPSPTPTISPTPTVTPTPTVSGALQLSKEYIYAGGRLLAVEEAGN